MQFAEKALREITSKVTNAPRGSHAGPVLTNEHGETVENLLTIPECARLVGTESDIARLIAAGKVTAHGVARLVDPSQVTRGLSELRPQAQDLPKTPLAIPRPEGPRPSLMSEAFVEMRAKVLRSMFTDANAVYGEAARQSDEQAKRVFSSKPHAHMQSYAEYFRKYAGWYREHAHDFDEVEIEGLED